MKFTQLTKKQIGLLKFITIILVLFLLLYFKYKSGISTDFNPVEGAMAFINING